MSYKTKLIKICENTKEFDIQLKYCQDTKSIGIHYGLARNLSNLDISQVDEIIDSGSWNVTHEHMKKMFHLFLFNLNIGDDILLGRGGKTIVGKANIASDYYYDPFSSHHHRRQLDPVIWDEWQLKPLTGLSHAPHTIHVVEKPKEIST